MDTQVDKSHYHFGSYITKSRWASMWYQLDLVLSRNPEHVLEVGPGPGIFKALVGITGVNIQTLDIDEELKPDHVASALEMPFEDNAFDVVCSFQVLEHMPLNASVDAFHEMARVARKAIVISIPDAATRWPLSIYLPKIGSVRLSVPRPRLRAPVHKFDGQHYWELNKAGYEAQSVIAKLNEETNKALTLDFRVPENPYHRFLVFEEK